MSLMGFFLMVQDLFLSKGKTNPIDDLQVGSPSEG